MGMLMITSLADLPARFSFGAEKRKERMEDVQLHGAK